MSNCFTVIDLDVTDKQREVLQLKAVGAITAKMEVYALRGGRLKLIASPEGEDLTADGLGKVTLKEVFPTQIMGYWMHDDDYVLTKQGTLKHLPRKLYRMGKQGYAATLLVDLPLVTSPSNRKRAFVAKKGTKVIIEGCDEKSHCRLVDAQKRRGWFKADAHTVTARKKDFDEVFGK